MDGCTRKKFCCKEHAHSQINDDDDDNTAIFINHKIH